MPTFTPTTLTTPRLTLRWLDAADTDAQFAIFGDPAVMRYGAAPAWTERAQAEAAVARAQAEYIAGSALKWAVVRRDTGQMIGNVNLYAFVASSRRCDLGYALARAHWGAGFAREALAAALAHAFDVLDLNRIEADIDPRNAPSARILDKLGFVREGYMPERWIVGGEVCDTVCYGLLRRHWLAR